MVTTYYLPYLSGLTKFVERLGKALALRGVEVIIVTSRHHPGLLQEEQLGGVTVIRVPVWAKWGKGVVMPGLFQQVVRQGRQVDLVALILPQAEAGPLASLVERFLGKPLVVVLLCDVELGEKFSQRVVEQLLRKSHLWAIGRAKAVVTLSADYAQHLPMLRRLGAKLRVIPPPVPQPELKPERVAELRRLWGMKADDPVVGWVGRVSREKGLDVLARAMPLVWEKVPQARVLCAGPKEEVFGEKAYHRRVASLVGGYGSRWVFTGVLPEEDLAAFYSCLSVLAFPSVGRTEAFGMVQVEAMACGTPVVASDLPGVREPVRTTGMGILVPPGQPEALAYALIKLLGAPEKGACLPLGALAHFSPENVAEKYYSLFLDVAS